PGAPDARAQLPGVENADCDVAHAARLGQIALVGETPSQRAGGKPTSARRRNGSASSARSCWFLLPQRHPSRLQLTCNVASCRLILRRRTELVKRIRKIAKAKNATATFDEGSSHTIVRFNGARSHS
ncbi:MAG: hypothetical protein M3508_02055, partial [Actinomycetota bacterium]|nr:hypothetical protein [Actinomycetota bacterium]